MQESPPRGSFPIWHTLMGLSGWVLFAVFPNIPLAVLAGLLTLMALPRFIRGPLEKAEAEVARELRRPVEPSRRVAKVMFPSERLLMELHLHPISFFWWWAACILVIAGAVALDMIMPTSWPTAITVIPMVIIALAIIVVIIRVVVWRHDVICLTDRRIFLLYGWTTLKLEFMPLQKMANESLIVPWQSRLLAQLRFIRDEYGTIKPDAAGEEGRLGNMTCIPHAVGINVLIAENVLGDH